MDNWNYGEFHCSTFDSEAGVPLSERHVGHAPSYFTHTFADIEHAGVVTHLSLL